MKLANALVDEQYEPDDSATKDHDFIEKYKAQSEEVDKMGLSKPEWWVKKDSTVISAGDATKKLTFDEKKDRVFKLFLWYNKYKQVEDTSVPSVFASSESGMEVEVTDD